MHFTSILQIVSKLFSFDCYCFRCSVLLHYDIPYCKSEFRMLISRVQFYNSLSLASLSLMQFSFSHPRLLLTVVHSAT